MSRKRRSLPGHSTPRTDEDPARQISYLIMSMSINVSFSPEESCSGEVFMAPNLGSLCKTVLPRGQTG